MKKFDLEVIQYEMNAEKAALKRLERIYQAALNAINEKIAAYLGRNDANIPHVIHHVEYQRMIKEQVQAVLDKLHAAEYETMAQYIEDSYDTGYTGTMYRLHHQDVPIIVPIDRAVVAQALNIETKLKHPLYKTLGIDLTAAKNAISDEITRGIASGLLYSEITQNIGNALGVPLKRARIITRTEAGRVQEQATQNAAEKAKEKGADVVKQWSAIRDERTRYNHRLLDGQIREIDEYFEVGGHKALRPHGFGIASEDCNCRCTSLIRARVALDADEYKRMQEKASQHGLTVKNSKAYGKAKAKDFADFKKKYLKITENETGAIPLQQ